MSILICDDDKDINEIFVDNDIDNDVALRAAQGEPAMSQRQIMQASPHTHSYLYNRP
jgi:hypothetical protein